MKNLLIAAALMLGLSAQAKTINYDVFASKKTVESSSKVRLNVFDFRITEVVASKTVVTSRCHSNGPIRDRAQTGLCSDVTLSKIQVAQVVLSFKPFGTTDRYGEVNNGKRTEFVKFNISLDDMSASDIETLRNGKRKARKQLASEIFNFNVERSGRMHTISL
ncbi:hypothetical protein [Bacteriovorax sp. DB6_IX]|uniref:hypothetical protein n=1 Tax=Bacteriovorax sp. DB6_IX TaxID=1353530 RepID=UPI00038A1656|nr:hypothetical protein [Bacteriovorax sp. DB6_IX]EQC51693.1 hypothetical protein M901_0284 [Bacteriovorax sp. DB6_IX]